MTPTDDTSDLEGVLARAGWVFWAGLGGCAAIADHMASEVVTGFGGQAPGRRSLSLTANAAVLTALANDDGFEGVVSAQLRVLARPDDVSVLLSTSGESPAMVQAARAGQELGLVSLGITRPETTLATLCDHLIPIEPGPVPAMQDHQSMRAHDLCKLVLGLS